jgi:NitT/TauT family transport system substrate-binding protein
MFAAQAIPALALDLTVTHFGTGMYGVPFAVAKEKGYFKESGLDVTGFITSAGGGTTVRNAMASEIPYGEVALPAAIAAIKQAQMAHSAIHGAASWRSGMPSLDLAG